MISIFISTNRFLLAHSLSNSQENQFTTIDGKEIYSHLKSRNQHIFQGYIAQSTDLYALLCMYIF